MARDRGSMNEKAFSKLAQFAVTLFSHFRPLTTQWGNTMYKFSNLVSEDPPWTIIGVVVGVVVVMVPAIGFVTWRIRKKRKKNYRRETKQ